MDTSNALYYLEVTNCISLLGHACRLRAEGTASRPPDYCDDLDNYNDAQTVMFKQIFLDADDDATAYILAYVNSFFAFCTLFFDSNL
jgi:hypothetical protein